MRNIAEMRRHGPERVSGDTADRVLRVTSPARILEI